MTSSTGEPCHLAGELPCTELLCPAPTWGLPWPDMRWPGAQCCRVGLTSQPSGRCPQSLLLLAITAVAHHPEVQC